MTKENITSSLRRVAILGSTGSIGTQALDVISEHSEILQVTVLAAGRNADLLIKQCREFRPRVAIIADESKYRYVSEALTGCDIEVLAGADAMSEAVQRDDVDVVLTATVGYSGLPPTVCAIKAGKDIALANKETLVVAGELIERLLGQSKSRIYPVDSEHSAIYQCLVGEDKTSVSKLIVTASGGPFRLLSKEDMKRVTVKDALMHPKWKMGAKITVDSSTMINKAFEIIEARWLFGIPAERIEAVVHPQSIIHSMVQFTDGAVKAQLGVPDMHLPISYALGYARRLPSIRRELTIEDYASMTFERPDIDRFPCLALAHQALSAGGTTACVINAANEIAVASFLDGKIGYTDIYDVIAATLDRVEMIQNPEYDHYVNINDQARAVAVDEVNKRR